MGSRRYFVSRALAFLFLAVVFRLHIGSIFTLAALLTLADRWILEELDTSADRDAGRNFALAIQHGLYIAGATFIFMAAVNAGLRTVSNDWRWLAPP